MRITHSTNPLPRLFHTHPAGTDIVTEALLKISNHSRLRAKLLVFESNKGMAHFFTHALNRPGAVCPKTQGICSGLAETGIKFLPDGTERHRLIVDPRYFCLIGLIRKHINIEVISHECVHAAYAYRARQNRRQWSREDDLPEEEICYPAGILTRLCVQHLTSEGLL